MHLEGNYVMPGVTHQVWCNVCQAEPAVQTVEAELGEAGSNIWVPIDLGENCLTELREDDRL